MMGFMGHIILYLWQCRMIWFRGRIQLYLWQGRIVGFRGHRSNIIQYLCKVGGVQGAIQAIYMIR